jgi:hypothetical protein
MSRTVPHEIFVVEGKDGGDITAGHGLIDPPDDLHVLLGHRAQYLAAKNPR